MKFTPSHRAAGFTTIELMTAVAIIGILAALAGPSFAVMIERWRVREAAESLQATLSYARSEAIKRGGNITVSKDPLCSSGRWECGWKVATSGGETLRVVQPVGGLRIAASVGDSVPLNRWGQPGSSAAMLEWRLEPVSGKVAASSRVCLGKGGVIRRLSYNGATSSVPNC